jgi:hypothetical protein
MVVAAVVALLVRWNDCRMDMMQKFVDHNPEEYNVLDRASNVWGWNKSLWSAASGNDVKQQRAATASGTAPT